MYADFDLTPVIQSDAKAGFPYNSPQGGPKMKKERFTKQQIITILKEHEAGIKIPELSQQHGVSAQSIYRWKAKYRRFVVFVHSTSKFIGAVLVFQLKFKLIKNTEMTLTVLLKKTA